jgi:hypothetical protein
MPSRSHASGISSTKLFELIPTGSPQKGMRRTPHVSRAPHKGLTSTPGGALGSPRLGQTRWLIISMQNYYRDLLYNIF